jgi:hypothetical protein
MTANITDKMPYALFYPYANEATSNAVALNTPPVRHQVSFVGSPPITAQDRLNVSSTSSDDQTVIASPDTTSVHRKVSFASQLSENELSPIPYHRSYQPIQPGRPSPLFAAGRYRFPTPAHRFLPPDYAHPRYKPHHPGRFSSAYFNHVIWPTPPIVIVDPHIISITPETLFFGIEYNIEVRPSAWNNSIISRGTVMVFRGFKSSTSKYIATWALETNSEYVSVQFSAFQSTQDTHYNDVDWPTIRINIPIHLCQVNPIRHCPPYITPVQPPLPPSTSTTQRWMTWLKVFCRL